MHSQRIDISGSVQAEREKRLSKANTSFEELLTWLRGPAQKLQLHQVERELFDRLMSLGVALVGVWLTFHLPLDVASQLRSGRGWYGYRDLTGDRVRTRFGEVWMVRPVYELVSGKGPWFIAPEDRSVGLASGRMSLGVHLLVAWLAARMVFDDVVATLDKVGAYSPSKRAVLGIVDELGPQATAFLHDMPPPDGDGDVLVIQTDGKGAPMIGTAEHRRRCKPHQKGPTARATRRRRRRAEVRVRRGKGKRSKNARMATVAVVYTLRRLPDGTLDGPLNKRVMATFSGKRRLFELARQEAVRRGYGKKPTYFLADGDLALWNLWKEYFPEATPCVDWYHVCEYLWAAGGTVHTEGSPELAAWVYDRQDELLKGTIDQVFTALENLREHIGRSGPGTPGRRKRLNGAIKFLKNHRAWLRYAELERFDMDIGTGAVEGAINYVIGRRLDGSMMRWTPARADHVLALRCVQYNGHWDQFSIAVEEAHSRRRSPVVDRITPQHRQAPYDAVRKAA